LAFRQTLTNKVLASSSTVHIDLNAEKIQAPQEIQSRRRGQRIRKPPPCGTHQHLEKKVVY
jgi:hypothetical protein